LIADNNPPDTSKGGWIDYLRSTAHIDPLSCVPSPDCSPSL
jgi:hypothetical protein